MVSSETKSPFFQTHTKRRSIDGLPPRPPTPPRESPRSKKTTFLKDPFAATDSNIAIAESSPPSSESSSTIAADRPKKRVLWSPWTKYHKPDVPLTSTPIRSRIDPKGLKSILKPSPVPLYNDSLFGRPIAAHTFTSFATMLESILASLASSDRSRKLDSYITFSNTLRAYDEIPDMKAMEEKLPTLCGFIRRDLDAKLEDGGNTDSQIIQQAIKLLVILAWTPRLVEAMDDPNATFFLENAIAKIEDPATPKIIVNHNLHLLAQQKFPPRIVTSERANRIVSALETLDERVTGKSITKERIDIYYKLLFQAKYAMLARVGDWMDNLFGGLLSSVSEVRNRALICIAEVSRALGKEKAIPRALTNIFSRVVKSKRMFDSIKERLDQFIRDGEGVFVARMWGIVLLCVKTIGDHWEYFTPWLRIIEGCFNVGDKDVKVEAQVAWSKLIYSMNIGPNTTRKLLGLLCKPLEQYLDPKNAYSNTKKPRKAAMANVSVLLYYGFRPNATNKQLSDVWDLVVVGLVEKMALSSKEEVAEGCSILATMFDDSAQRTWQETRVLTAPPMAADDVPRLDPKWVRSNTSLVLNTLEVALKRGHWKEEVGVKPLWKNFTKTLADAGSKEVKVSAELMEAVAHLFNMFQRLWTTGPSALIGAKEPPPTISTSFIKKFVFLVISTLESLGTIPFTEKHLSYDDASKFSPAATPTHKYSSGTSSVVLHPPILHMFQLFLRPPADVFVDEEYYESVRSILWKCILGQDSRRKKLGLLSACVNLLPHRDARELDKGMWQILGQLARKCLPTPAREKTLLTLTSPVVAEFRDVIRVLEWGCKYELHGWKRLYDEFCAVVVMEQGDVFVPSVVIEPIAEALRHQVLEVGNTQSLKKAVMLVERAAWQNSDKTFKTAFGAGRRAGGVDSFEKLADLLDYLLKRSYTLCAEGMSMADPLALMAAVGEMIGKWRQGGLLLLKRVQEGLGVWVVDEKQIVGGKGSDGAVRTFTLWMKVLEGVERLPAHDGKVLDTLQVLVTSGLQSRWKQVVNATIKVWNETFGKQGTLLYPKSVRGALKKLRPIADLSLPTFPESLEGESVHTPPQFSESQDLCEDTTREKDAWSTSPSRRLASPFRKSASPGVRDTLVSRRTPVSARKPPSRPKHMDSQIEFAPIDGGATMMDSQVLTEHQKEVKERQGEAVGSLFSGLRVVEKVAQEVANEMGISRIEETQTSLEENETVSFISQMPKEGSYPQFLATKTPEESGDGPNGSLPSEKNVAEELAMGPPTKDDWEEGAGAGEEGGDEDDEDEEEDEEDEEDEDDNAEISNPTEESSDYGSSIMSDPPSIDEDFVDAPDQPPSGGDSSALQRKAMTVMVEVNVPENLTPSLTSADLSEASSDKNKHSSPDAQIIDEERASQGLLDTPEPVRGKGKGKKGSVVKSSPGMLDTIVISGDSGTPSSGPSYRMRKSQGSEGGEKVEESGGTVEDTPVVGTPSGSKSAGRQEKAAEATPSRASKGKQRQEKPADTPSRGTKTVKAYATPSRSSPPRTRSSARKGASETPRLVMLEPASRKRKFNSAESPLPGNESRQSSAENFPSPTPKGRRRKSGSSPPAKRTRSFTDVPVDPDVSFVGETQLSFGSSIPDTYEQGVDELVNATPYAGRKAVSGIFEKEAASQEVEVVSTPGKRRRAREVEESPKVEIEVTPSKKRKTMGKQSIKASRSPAQRSLSETEESGQVPPSSQVQLSSESVEAALVAGEANVLSSVEEEVTGGQEAIEKLRNVLQVLDEAALTPAECREVEEIFLGAFMGMRGRGVMAGSSL